MQTTIENFVNCMSLVDEVSFLFQENEEGVV